jgi:hypothetical protein
MTDEVDYIGVMTYYEGVGRHVTPDQVAGRKVLWTKVTHNAAVALTWTGITTNTNQISSNNQQLETGHLYALAAIHAYNATGIAVRAKHNDWGGCKPGGMLGTTIYHKKNLLDFAKHGSLPVFSASNPLDIEVFASGTDIAVVIVGVIDVTDIGGTVGIEDFNLAKGTTTNGTTTFTLLTVVAGDTLYVKDGIGTARLRGWFLTGTAPLRGQLRSTDLSFQPNPIEIPPHCTVAGDFLAEILAPMPELKPNSLINCYATS